MSDAAEGVQPVEAPRDRASLISAIEAGDRAAWEGWLDCSSREDAVHALSQLVDDDRLGLLRVLKAERAAEVLELLPRPQAVDASEDLDAPVAADIVEELWSDDRADLIRELDAEDAEAIFTELDAETLADIRKLAAYEEDAAGSLMHTEYLAFRDHITIRELLANIEANAEAYADYNIQYTYVIDGQDRLVGV